MGTVGYTTAKVQVLDNTGSEDPNILEKFYYWVMENKVKLEGVKVCAKENFSDVEKYFKGTRVRYGVDTVLEYGNGAETVVFKFDTNGDPVIGECVYEIKEDHYVNKYSPSQIHTTPYIQPSFPNQFTPIGIAEPYTNTKMQPWELNDNMIIGGKNADDMLEVFKNYSYHKTTDASEE